MARLCCSQLPAVGEAATEVVIVEEITTVTVAIVELLGDEELSVLVETGTTLLEELEPSPPPPTVSLPSDGAF